ncbi:hypothetical protein LCGC14_1023490 [marine sediment metagenome]|uniref:Uncharacterized protein n=1 Tax=marine sediment metagenome TaxID=412755 RepID=A0A0F9QES8_9ZZZZ
MKDSTIVALGLIAAVTIVSLAFFLKKKDTGTMIERDAQGNIVAILPALLPYISNRVTTNPTASAIDYTSLEHFQETGM